jgi:hypothetical protein
VNVGSGELVLVGSGVDVGCAALSIGTDVAFVAGADPEHPTKKNTTNAAPIKQINLVLIIILQNNGKSTNPP